MTDENWDSDPDEEPTAPGVDLYPCPSWITPQTPLSLPNAAKFAFPDGSITGSILRAQADRGLLTVETVGRTRMTTLAYIAEMRERCRHPANPHASSSDAARAARPSTSSSTRDLKSARDAALIVSERRRKRSRPT